MLFLMLYVILYVNVNGYGDGDGDGDGDVMRVDESDQGSFPSMVQMAWL